MKSVALSLGLVLALGSAAQAVLGPQPMPRPPVPIPALRTVIPTAVQPFDLDQVRLLDGPEKAEMQADRKYLHDLDADRLLLNFRRNAGLPAPGKPLGGWEAPDCELRGHFVGHYLSACALMYRSDGDISLKQKANAMVAELAKCQRALGGKYLSAFPASFFDRVETGKPVWAPYYTVHKIMAGLVDVYQYCGNRQALQVAENMADYFEGRTDRLTDVRFDAMMGTEFGGMANVLYDLYAINHRPADLALAHRFDQASFLGPLALRHDDLTDIHANTHLPKILGAARRYELLDDTDYHTAVTYFWDRVANHRSYATGGSNRGEFWGDPDDLAQTLVGNNQETCTTYNMLKITRHLIRWTADPRYADFYERAYFNGILPAQRPDTGMMIYYLPLAAGNVKNWGTPDDSFWCCYGTGVESFAKLNDSIYFHDADGLYVNLYVPSEVTWPQKGLRVTQQTRFPQEQESTFIVHAARPRAMALHLHVPYWANGYTVAVNGKPVNVLAKPTSYAVVRRVWKDGDTVRVVTPMRLHTQAMPDDPAMRAVMYGPLVLAGIMDAKTPLTPDRSTTGSLRETSSNPAAWLKRVPGQPLTFRTVGQNHNVTFVPIYKIIDQHFGVYWSVITPGSARDRRIAALIAQQRQHAAAYAARVVDSIVPGDAASEKAHNLVADGSGSGTFNGGHYRDGHAYGWDLKVLPDAPMTLDVTYWGDESAPRTFDILVNGQKIATQSLDHNKPGQFFDVEYSLPASLTANPSNTITVRFQAHDGSIAGGVFGCATLKPAAPDTRQARE